MSALAGGRTTLSPTTQTTDKRMGPARLEWCTKCAAVDWIIPAETHTDLEREWLRLDGLADRIGTPESRQDAERARWAYRAAIESAATHAGCGGRIERHRFTAAEREQLGRLLYDVHPRRHDLRHVAELEAGMRIARWDGTGVPSNRHRKVVAHDPS